MNTERRKWLARSVRIALGATAVMIVMVATGTARAQDFPPPPGGGGPGGPGGRGGFGGGPMGRGGMRGPGRPASLSTAPLDALSAALTLTESQVTKVEELQKKWAETERSERDAAGIQMPRPPRGGQGGFPSEEDREAMRAQFETFIQKQQAFEKALEPKRKASDTAITAILNDTQKKALPEALKSIDALQMAGIPSDVHRELNLTAAQRAKLAAVADKYAPKPGERPQGGQGSPGGGPGGFGGGPGGPGGFGGRGGGRQSEARTATLAILTDAQKKVVSNWEREHPRPERGPGGFGRPGGGGRGGDFPPPPPGE